MHPVSPRVIRSNEPIETVPYLASVIPANRLDELDRVCRLALRNSPGDILEIGVYRGGSLARLCKTQREICSSYKCIGIDTFKGHPYSDGHPVHPVGKYSDVSLSALEEHLRSAGLREDILLIEGAVESVLEDLDLSSVSFVHVDCDLYVPVSACARVLPHRIAQGAVIYFDDYGHDHCPGATRAVDEVFPHSQIREVSMPDGTCWSCVVEL